MMRRVLLFLGTLLTAFLLTSMVYAEGKPFVMRWKGEKGKELKISIFGTNYKLVIKKASDNSVLDSQTLTIYEDNKFYSYTPTEDGELLVEAGPEGVDYVSSQYGSADKLLKVEQFGTVVWKTMESAFVGCENMQFAENIDIPNLTSVTNLSGMFTGCSSFNQNIDNWDVSNVTTIDGLFYTCSAFNQPLNSWDVSNVTSMENVFGECSAFNQPLDNWRVGKVTSMYGMFSSCTAFNQPLDTWDVSKVTDMNEMFSNCSAFNQNLGTWKLKSCAKLGIDNCGMSLANYSKSLKGWAAQNDIKEEVRLLATNLKYAEDAVADRNTLVNNKKWVISRDRLVKYHLDFDLREITITKGQEHTLALSKIGLKANETVTLSSSEPTKVEILDATAFKIKGLEEGEVTITATVAANSDHGELKATCKVTVLAAPAIAFSAAEVSVVKGKQLVLDLQRTGLDASEKVTLTSSADGTVMIADNDAMKIEGVAEGEATITATVAADAKHEELKATCKVIVLAAPAIAFSAAEVSVVKGKQLVLDLQRTGLDASEKVTLTSSADGTVKIADNDAMKVEGVAEGEATITATVAANARHEELKATCKVVVMPPTAVDDVIFASVVITPNPFGAQLRIINGNLRGMYELFDVQGVEVATGVLENTETRINTVAFTKGIYLLRLTTENGAVKTIKVAKNCLLQFKSVTEYTEKEFYVYHF